MPMNEHQDAIAIRQKAEAAATLFPALLVEAERIAQTVAAGLHGRRRAGPGETFWQHRAYAFGDPVSAIDWRQSARVADRLYVRENEWEAAAAVFLWADTASTLDYSSSKNTPTKKRRADILAVALTILLSQAGERIGLLGAERRPYHGRTAPARILEALINSAFDESVTGHVPPIAELQPGARIVLLSDFYTDLSTIEATAAEYAAQGAKGALVQICDPAEQDFPFTGRIEFQNVGSKDRLTFGDTQSLASSYRFKFASHRDGLSTIAQKLGWTFITHRTDNPAQTALMALYAALGDQRGGN